MPSSTFTNRRSRRQLLAENRSLSQHATELEGDLAFARALIQKHGAEQRLDRGVVAEQPILLPTDVIQARIEVGLVRADRARLEQINDRLRGQIRQKDAAILALMEELRQARLAILAGGPVPPESIPWQALSSAV